MSTAENCGALRSAPAEHAGWLSRRVQLSLFVLALWAWVMWAGKEVGWDFINHHLYLPFSWLNQRHAVDLFAAGPQSYLHPLGYLPFYALLAAGAPSWLIGTLMALAHALIVLPLWAIAMRLWPHPTQQGQRAMAMLLALLSPSFLQVIGTSSSDPWSAVLIVAALAALLRQQPSGLLWCAAWAALAVVVKLTNLVFIPALLAVAAARLLSRQATWGRFAAAVALGVLVIGVLAGPWGWWLWQSFGNPVFPLFNEWFKSPYAPIERIVAARFVMTNASDLLTRPFELASFRAYSGNEGFSPDLRPAALVLLALPALLVGLAAVARRGAARRIDLSSPPLQVGLFVVLAYAGWMMTSGNTRYALPLLALVGVLLAWCAYRALPRGVAAASLALLAALQALYFGVDGDSRFGPTTPWGRAPMLEVQVPQRLRDDPFLHLSVGSLSYAALALYMHPAGALSNVIGGWSLPTDGRLGRALQDRMDAWQGRTRVLVRAAPGWQLGPEAESAAFRQRVDRLLYRFAQQVDWRDCLDIELHSGPRVQPGQGASSHRISATLTSCAIGPRTRSDPRYDADLATAEQVFKVLESSCPIRLSPSPQATDADGLAFQRRYLNSESRITVAAGGATLSHFRTYQIAYLGSVPEILAGRGTNPCEAWARLTAH